MTLACWNNDKQTLLEIGARGIPIPKTILLDEQTSFAMAFERLEGEIAVLKPCWGGSGVGVELVLAGDSDALTKAREALPRPFMLQEYLPEIEDGELSFTFIGGQYAHAVLKRPAPGEFRINSRYKPMAPIRAEADQTLVADAENVMKALPAGAPLYARVDGVARSGRLICTEVELADPSLYLDIVPETADLFADATLAAIIEFQQSTCMA